jgi:hypothetical protein
MDLTNLTWLRFAELAGAVALIDWVVGVLAAIAPPNYFSWANVAKVLETHVLKRILPIAGLAFLAAAVPAGSPEHIGFYGSAIVALGAYVGETAKSLISSYTVAKAVAADVPSPDLSSGPIPEDPLAGVPQ